MRPIPSNEAAALVGMSLRQLRYLAQTGLVRPSVRAHGGRGSAALYALDDLRAMLVVERVRAICGPEIRVERLRRVLDALRSAPEERSGFLVLDGEGCWVEPGPLESTLRHAQAALVIDLGAVSEQLLLRVRRAGITPAAHAA